MVKRYQDDPEDLKIIHALLPQKPDEDTDKVSNHSDLIVTSVNYSCYYTVRIGKEFEKQFNITSLTCENGA